MTPGKPGVALDDDEAVAALRKAGRIAASAGWDADYWPKFLQALNDLDVVLVWDGPKEQQP